MMKRVFTSESVSEGHPDKVCDQISDSVLDAILAQDPYARVACETACTTGLVLVMGEITTNCYVDIPKLVRQTVLDIGYDDSSIGFDGNTCAVLTSIDEQSSDIAMGVNAAIETRASGGKDVGAGDQGMMFGFACDETPELMPLPISLAHQLCKKTTQARKSATLPFLRPDSKAQVTIEYDGDTPVRADAIVVSAQHSGDYTIENVRAGLYDEVIQKTVPAHLIDKNTRIYINPTGRFVIGGPNGDSGLTGRKIIVDTYGGYAPHGGGAFSGKDPTKVDRSAAYAARYVAKNVVAAGLARKCEVALSYAIGVAQPTSVAVNTFGTGMISNEALSELIQRHFDLRPGAILESLQLRRPIYRQTAAYGHFGRSDLDLPWESLDLSEMLKKNA
ncbi:MAG: methionine adenosyltransferase [Christensenellales bacterium]|jgi:S-adenosylmethionine synthetase